MSGKELHEHLPNSSPHGRRQNSKIQVQNGSFPHFSIPPNPGVARMDFQASHLQKAPLIDRRNETFAEPSQGDQVQAGPSTSHEDFISIRPQIPPGLIGAKTLPAFRSDGTIRDKHAMLTKDGLLSKISRRATTAVNGSLLKSALQLRPGDHVKLGMRDAEYVYTGSGLQHALAQSRLIGADHTESLSGDHRVDGTHAELDYQGKLINISQDFPTTLNTRILQTHEEVQLREGDLLQFGHSAEIYRFEGDGLRRYSASDFNRFLIHQNQLHAENTPKHTMVNDQNLDDIQNITLSNGDIVRFGDGSDGYAYFNNSRLVPLSRARGELLHSLFPLGVMNASFKQGKLRNCGSLSAIYAMIYHNPAKLLEMFDTKDGKISITTRDNPYHPMLFSGNDIQTSGVISNSAGVDFLETAMGRVYTWGDDTPTAVLDRNSNHEHNLFPFVTHPEKVDSIYRSDGNLLDFVDRVEDLLLKIKHDPQNKIGCVSFLNLHNKDLFAFDPKGKEILLGSHHSYTIIKPFALAHETNGIILSDPINTEQRLFLPLQEFINHLKAIGMADIS